MIRKSGHRFSERDHAQTSKGFDGAAIDIGAARRAAWNGLQTSDRTDSMTTPHTSNEPGSRRLMHRRAIECNGYLRDDGLWEVEARLLNTKTFLQRDQFRG